MEKPVTFEEIKAAPKAVLRFTADWCGPCKSLAPIFNEVAAEHPNTKVFIIDVDINGEIATKFGIRGIPTIMLVENGNVVKQISGARTKPEIEEYFV